MRKRTVPGAAPMTSAARSPCPALVYSGFRSAFSEIRARDPENHEMPLFFRMARFTMEANTSLAAGIPHPSIHVGEQSVFQVQKGTHCLLLDSLLIAEQTT